MRKRTRIALIGLLFLLKISVSLAQIDTTFWFAAPWVTPDHWWKDTVVLHISTFSASTVVKITQPALGSAAIHTLNTTVPPNTTLNFKFTHSCKANSTTLGYDSLESRPADMVLPYGLHITSDHNVTLVYDIVDRGPSFLNPETFSLMGQNGLGTEFVCPFQTNTNNQPFTSNTCGANASDLNCDGIVTQPKQQINIIASQPNTLVWITPRCNIIGHLANVTYSVLLPTPGSVYTCENAVQATSTSGNNLSGTIVVSDKPISVTVGDDSVKGVTGCFDLMGDQIVPTDIVGTDYIIIKGHMFANEFEGGYIVATQDFTNLSIDDSSATNTYTTLNKGDTYFYKTTKLLTYVHADKNVYCLHATGKGCEFGEAILPPLNCAGSNLVAFSRNTPQKFYLNLLCKNGAQSTFTLNNNTASVNIPITSGNFSIVPGTSSLSGGPYYGAQLTLTSTAVLPIGSYTIGNTVDVFALGVLDGDSTTGGLYHYMSSFLRKNIVTTKTLAPVCAGQGVTVALTGNVSGGSVSGNWTTNGSGIFTPVSSSGTITSIYTLSNNDTLQSSLTFSLASVGDCKPVVSTTSLAINQRPQVNAGLGTAMCKNNVVPIVLAGTFTNAVSATWSVSTGASGGVFGPPGANTTYTPSLADLAANVVTFSLISVFPNAGCSVVYDTLTVRFVNPPLVDPGPNLTACTNSSTLALNGTVTAATSGIWNTTGTGLFFPGNASPTATYQLSFSDLQLSQITLTLTSTGNGLCAAVSNTVAINIIPAPVLTVPSDFTVCANLPAISLPGSVTGGATGIWSSTDGTGSFTQLPPASATYTLGAGDIITGGVNFILTSVGGFCPSETDTFHVAVLASPEVSVNPDNSVVCKNAPIDLNGQVAGYTNTGEWSSTGNGVFSPTNTALGGQYLPSSGDVSNGSVILTLSSTNNQGCPATAKSFTAVFIPSPKAIFTPAAKHCKDEGVLFSNTSLANGTDSLKYQWTFGDTSGVSIATDPLHTYNSTGSYVITLTVTGTSIYNVSCPDTTSRRIFVNATPIANYDFLNGCKNLITQFRDSSSVFGGSIIDWSWQFGDNSPSSTIKNPTHTYTSSATFNVLLTVTSNNFCTQSVSKVITINPSPQAQFGLTNNPAVAQEPIYFSDFSTPVATIKQWYWDFGDNGSSDQQGPSHIYQNAGTYTITLTVYDNTGCSDTISKLIDITLLPQVPSGFSPNNDGHNDILLVKGGPFGTMAFKVYNSWGEVVFESTDQNIGWDGKKNGVDQPLGVYVWTLVVNVYNNRQVKKNGDVTLTR